MLPHKIYLRNKLPSFPIIGRIKFEREEDREKKSGRARIREALVKWIKSRARLASVCVCRVSLPVREPTSSYRRLVNAPRGPKLRNLL
jgi:hypothetical protein